MTERGQKFLYFFMYAYLIIHYFLYIPGLHFSFQKKKLQSFYIPISSSMPLNILILYEYPVFHLYLFFTVVRKLILHLTNYLQVSGLLYIPNFKVSSIFLIHWANYFCETA